MSSAPFAPLIELGFTALEAEIYSWLLEQAPVTGYRIAKALRKPAPNIYKALESLEAKGAVLVDEEVRRLYRAVPPSEVLGHLERSFQKQKALAARALSEVDRPEGDDRVYRLSSAEAVFERARAMLARAEQVALLDVFPAALETLRPALEEAAARGVETAALAYAPAAVPGVRVVETVHGEAVRDRWPGQWLCLVVDGAEHLIALLSGDGTEVRQAVWTGSLYLSWVYHSAHAAEIILAAVERAAADASDADAIRRALDDHLHLKTLHAPGYRDLRRRVIDPTPPGGNGI